MISVVIPAYNEEHALPDTLARLFSQAGDYEVILVDGGSTDGTRAIAECHGDVQIVRAPKGRAAQMNAGAAKARGEWLLFLHADTLLPEQGLARIADLPAGVNRRCVSVATRRKGTPGSDGAYLTSSKNRRLSPESGRPRLTQRRMIATLARLRQTPCWTNLRESVVTA